MRLDMQEIIKYRSSTKRKVDGIYPVFDTKDECIKYEKLLVLCEQASKLVPRPDNWNDPSVKLQNSEKNLIEFNRQFKQILIEYTDSDIVNMWDLDRKGIIGRYLCDGCDPTYDAIYKLYDDSVLCVGSNGKSYGQPAFVP